MEHVQQRLTILIPPRTYRMCTFCKAKYTVPLSDDPALPQTRCLPCQKCEKCSRCKKLRKESVFAKMTRATQYLRLAMYVVRKMLCALSRNAFKRSPRVRVCASICCKKYSAVLTLWLCHPQASVGVFRESIRFLWEIVRPNLG